MAIFLILVVTLLGFANYNPNTILSGWDTLHPEFNWSLYFQRVIFGIWQEIQGLGAVAVQAHASDISRLLIYFPLSFFFDIYKIRYAYIFLTLIVGTLGCYFFIKKITLNKLIGVAGSLVYLFNLGTLQQYALPLEMFATHFATLPWLLYLGSKYLDKETPKNLLIFSVVSFFSTSIAHTPTLFYIYLFLFGLYLIGYSIKKLKSSIKAIFILIISTLIINSFWLLPNIYLIVTQGREVINAKINSQFSQKAFLTERAAGTISNTMILKNYLFEWGKLDTNSQEYVKLLKPWEEHLKNPIVLGTSYLIFCVVILGLLISLIHKDRYGIALSPVFIIAFFAIANGTPLVSETMDIFRRSSPLFGEAIRFPFTKFSTILALNYAVFFSLALNYALKSKKLLIIFLIGFIPLIFYFYLPAFNGEFIDSKMRTKIPEEYYDTMKWLNSQKSGSRIANLPINNYWGWVYYQWDYEGAGFLWFGFNSPTMNREFDRWSPYNENYYWEVSYALYSKNITLLENVLDKYQINYLLLDENVINPPSSKALFIDETKELLNGLKRFRLEKKFEDISVYSFNLNTPVNNYVYSLNNPKIIGPKYNWTNFDMAYVDYGHYISADKDFDAFYNYRTLFTGRKQEELEFDPSGLGGSILYEGNANEVDLTNLVQKEAYLFKFSAKNISGQPLIFWVENLNSRHSDLETYLPKDSTWRTYYFVQPPMDEYGIGYKLHFDNISIGEDRSVNDLGNLTVYKIPYRDFVKEKTVYNNKKTEVLSVDDVSRPNPTFYKINSPVSGTLVLSQSYNDGWIAINNGRILPGHVLVDNWANGWQLDGKVTGPIYLFFWPQLLEFLGFILLGGLFLILVLKLLWPRRDSSGM